MGGTISTTGTTTGKPAAPDAELLAAFTTSTAAPCKFRRILDSLGAEGEAAVFKALELGITQMAIAKTLTERGHAVTRDTASKHIEGRCSCQR